MSKKKNQGITLISLVITIIILLILATVAISLAMDGDGLFSKAGTAANTWNTSVTDEQTILQNLLDKADNIGKVNPVSEYITETSIVAGVEKERTAPIPTGYVASQVTGESTIAGGLVIYETETVVNDTNHDEALEDYNQYVWIPVDNINDMVMCQIHGASVMLDTTTLQCPTCGTVTKLAGKLYKTSIEEIESTDAEGNKIYILKYDMDFTKNNQTYEANLNYREPAVVTGNSTGDGTSEDGATDNYHGLGTANSFLAQLQSDFDGMAASVAEYGGFYISRYEVGANGSSKKGQTVMTADDAGQMWYGLYSTLKKTGASTTSQMIWGSQYDQVIKFIGSEAEVGHDDRGIVTSPAASGNNPDDEMQNIFDLEGNYQEFTSEAYGRAFRVLRGPLYTNSAGGGYSTPDDGVFASAAQRSYINPSVSSRTKSSSRIGLFVNL